MNKLAIKESIVGREIVLAQMCHHYRRISFAKARVDTNLYKLPKSARPLSVEEANIVQRSLSPRSPPKFKTCLKHDPAVVERCQFSPSPKLRSVESRLRSSPNVYHPAVKSQKSLYQCPEELQQATQTGQFDSEAAIARDAAVQTFDSDLYKPLDVRSVKFLRDITTEALRQRAYTSGSLNRILFRHQLLNVYSLPTELMERELEELRRQLGVFPKCQPTCCRVSDKEALDALNALVMDPRIKERVIHSLKLRQDIDTLTACSFDHSRKVVEYSSDDGAIATSMLRSSFQSHVVTPTESVAATPQSSRNLIHPKEATRDDDGLEESISEVDNASPNTTMNHLRPEPQLAVAEPLGTSDKWQLSLDAVQEESDTSNREEDSEVEPASEDGEDDAESEGDSRGSTSFEMDSVQSEEDEERAHSFSDEQY